MIDAVQLHKEKIAYPGGDFVELVVWRVPSPPRGSRHRFKYRFACVVDGVCVLRYDNEAGKGDHKHVGSAQYPLDFTDIERLRADFLVEAGRWLDRPDGDPGDDA